MGLRRALARLRTHLELSRMAEGELPLAEGRVWAHGGGTVRFGRGVRLDARLAPIELHAEDGAEIVLGDGALVEGGASIEASRSVVVGAGARLGAFCKVLDTHFHPLVGDRHQRPASAPVVVEPGAVVGPRAIVLPGARVTSGAVVPAGAVVRRAPVRRGEEARPAEASRGGPPAVWPRGLTAAAGGALSILRGRLVFRGCAREGRVHARGRVRLRGRDGIRVGDRVVFLAGMIPTEIACEPGATVAIGERTVLNYGVSIDAAQRVTIGRQCMLGSFVRLADRGPGQTAPIRIGDGVWLAHRVVVEPGVTVGDGSVVAAGSRVVRDVPPGCLASGDPARSIRLALAAGEPEEVPGR